jgi:hypothetical protein
MPVVEFWVANSIYSASSTFVKSSKWRQGAVAKAEKTLVKKGQDDPTGKPKLSAEG